VYFGRSEQRGADATTTLCGHDIQRGDERLKFGSIVQFALDAVNASARTSVDQRHEREWKPISCEVIPNRLFDRFDAGSR